jgi:D-glycero-D-manno-heptose 1,7-bisphosphate phosphatase
MHVRRRFVLVDRDGTINAERCYLTDPEQLELLPAAAAGLRSLSAAGLGLVVVTNQSAVGRGLMDEDRLGQIHERLHDMLAAEGVCLDGIYYCPHVPEAGCSCRKPAPGLALRAAAEFGFELSECFVVGDKPCDLLLGRTIGAATILVRTGYGSQTEADGSTPADAVADDLLHAAGIIAGWLHADAAARPAC